MFRILWIQVIKNKILEWAWRYGPAETAATLSGYLVALATDHALLNAVVVSYAASIADSGVFYAWNLGREFVQLRRRRPSYSFVRVSYVAFRNCLLEFGPAHALNSLVVQPWGIYFITKFTHSITVGFFSGTLLAEGGFYLLLITAYELRKRYVLD